jgi:pyrroline-5-carboxylate reductase
MKIGIIGCGNMGAAIAERLGAKYALFAFDKDESKLKGIKTKITPAADVADLLGKSEVVILAVKPQDFALLLEAIKKVAAGGNRLFISLAAGISTAYLERALGRVRVIRAMSNLPAQVGAGMTVLSKGAFAQETDLSLAGELFAHLGKTETMPEDLLDAVTAVSGSGPAFVCYFLQQRDLAMVSKHDEFLAEFIRATQHLGFNERQARQLVNQTYAGTRELLEKRGLSLEQLQKKVTSKGGTTEAGLKILEQGGSLQQALEAALNRAKELSRG